MGNRLHFTVAKVVPENAVGLAVVVKETALPDNTLDMIDRSADIQENVTTKFNWKKYARKGADPYYYDTWYDDTTEQTGVLPSRASGIVDQLLVTNISAFPEASGKIPIPLPYFYDIKFDHWSGSDNPENYISITDEFGNDLKYVNFKIKKSTQTYYDGFGGTFVDVGSFILGTSRLDSQAARTALGENIWQEQWGTSTIDSHMTWETSNTSLRYPSFREGSTLNHSLGQDTILEGCGDHAGEERVDAIAGDYYVTASGYWAGEGVGAYVADTSIKHPAASAVWGKPLQPGDGTVHADLTIAGTDATIGELLSADTLGGISFVATPSGTAASLGAWRCRLYLPEDIVDRPEQTFWVKYNRFNHPKDVEFGFQEIINPKQLNKENRDYTIDITNPDQPQIQAIANSGLDVGTPLQDSMAYIKRIDNQRIFLRPPVGTENQSWFLQVHNGIFRRGSQTVDVANVPGGSATGEETHNVYYHIPEIDTANFFATNWSSPTGALAGHGTHSIFEGLSSSETPRLGKVIKERVEIIDEYTLKVKNTPLYFWEGDYGKNATTGAQVGDGAFNYYTNSYPLYTPPNIIDHHIDGTSYLPEEEEIGTHPKHSHGINIYINDVLLDNSEILQWDFFNGILKLSTRINQTDDVRITYLHSQEFAIGTYLDLNPIFNHMGGDLVGEVLRIVIKPDWSETVDDLLHTYHVDTTDASDHKLAFHVLSENRTGVYDYDFLNASAHVGFNLIVDPSNPTGAVALPQQTLVLGDIVIKEHNIDDTQFLDARSRGGGIKPDEWFAEKAHAARSDMPLDPKARVRKNKESDYFWDIGYWDGIPYQAEGTLVIKIPLAKRDTLKNEIVEARYPDTGIDPTYKAAVDTYYSTHGQAAAQFWYTDYTYGTYSGCYADVTEDLSYANDGDRLIMDSVRDYIDIQAKAYEEADNRILDIIDKHIALGTFYVIVDENNNLWPIRYRRQ